MGFRIAILLIWVLCFVEIGPGLSWADEERGVPRNVGSTPGRVQRTGKIESNRLVECSGIDMSLADDDLLWAINDGGNGPFLFALGRDGRDRGVIRISGATNRDWEDLSTFSWQGRSMILIADFGDNKRRHETHTLYFVLEPVIRGERTAGTAVTEPAWQIEFSYPDGAHDAEAVAVDALGKMVYILTKRDEPPILFVLPLDPSQDGRSVVARRVAFVNRIPPPTTEDRRFPYGRFRSQPTAMDLSDDGLSMVVLTYKHAYLLDRSPEEPWSDAAVRTPTEVSLPLPQIARDLKQREAVCFSKNNASLLVTSEGRGAGLIRVERNSQSVARIEDAKDD